MKSSKLATRSNLGRVFVAFFCVVVWQVAAQMAPVSLAPPDAVPLPVPTSYPALTDLPSGVSGQNAGDQPASVHAGTPGRALAAANDSSGTSFAILGDRTAGADWGLKYLRQSIAELNELHPDFVMTIGDMVQGYTRSGKDYADQAQQFRQIIDQLTMPWYPTAGNHDVISGTQDSGDHRFEALYKQTFGPLYYSIDYRDLHVIVLYSDEQLQGDPVISEQQLAWLKGDLNKAFDNHRIRHVFVLMHKPMWRSAKSNWDKAHEMLVEFNHRPVVAIEGPGQPLGTDGGGLAGTEARRPRVDAVFAGHLHSYSQEPVKDGIGYYVVAVTGGAIDQDRYAGQLQSYLWVKVDSQPPAAGGSAVHLALVEPGAIHAQDFVTAADRAIAARIHQFDEHIIGIEGTLDQPLGVPSGSKDAESQLMKLILSNPLEVPIDVAVRMASTKNLITPAQHDNANPLTDNYDSPWELHLPYQTKHLKPGEQSAYSMAMYCPAQGAEVPPPQVEFVVSFTDSKGRTVPTVIKQRIPLVPSLTVPLLKTPPTPIDWENAPRGGTYSFVPNPYDSAEAPPEFWVLADNENIYVKVHAEDKRFTYFPKVNVPASLPTDAVAIAFAPASSTGNALAQRLVILPFAPEKPLILTNNGTGKDQTPLLPLDSRANSVTVRLEKDQEAYELFLAIPRKVIFPAGTGIMNVTVFNDDDQPHTTMRSWARDDAGPKGWGRLKLEISGGATH